MTGRLLVLGCGGHGRVVADAALDCGYSEVAFLDDAAPSGTGPLGLPVLGPVARLADLAADWPAAIAAIGDNALRLDLFRRLREAGFATPAIVHPAARVSSRAAVADGAFVAPMAAVNAGARIAEAAIVNTGACIDHDCVIGEAAHVAPGAVLSGAVTVGALAWLGTGCAVRQGIAIGARATVGVGAAVIRDIPPGSVYVGVPARPLPERS